jgi:DNA invertase Pin-like site-specific DNA recombinase
MSKAAAIYARISEDRDGRHLGVTRQTEDCQALAASRGWQVAEIYVDDDVSAYRGVRPAYRRLLNDLRSGLRDAVVVWHLDRLHRQPRELEEFFEVCDQAGVRYLASVTGDIDLATHDGRFLARILGAVSRKESDDKSRRLKRKHIELAHNGKVAGGGTRPYGYNSDRRTINEPEARVVRDAAKRILAGESLRSTCGDLNNRGVATVTGKPWTSQVLRRILMSGRISGQREHHKELVASAEWPGIISTEDTLALRRGLGDPARARTREPRRYILTSLVRCKLCGARLMARPHGNGRRRYVCATGTNFTGCGRITIVAYELEELVVEGVLYRLDSADLVAAVHKINQHQDDTAQLYADVRSAESQLEEVATAYGEGAITLREFLAARRPVEERLKAASLRLNSTSHTRAVDGYIGKAGRLKAEWPLLPLSRQRAIVAALLHYVVIGPGLKGIRAFDARRVTPIWAV